MQDLYSRIFSLFLGGGFVISTALFTIMLVSKLLSDMFLSYGMHGSAGDALLMLVLSPLYGASSAFFIMFLPLVTGGFLAMLAWAAFRRVPLWFVIATTPLCGLAGRFQAQWLSGEQLASFPSQVALFSAYQLPVMLICWWWTLGRAGGKRSD